MVDYHRWDHIEISDDEDDTHPNVDTPSLFRWRHQARLQRKAEKEQEKKQIKQTYTEAEKRRHALEEAIKADPSQEERLRREYDVALEQERKFREKVWRQAWMDRRERAALTFAAWFCRRRRLSGRSASIHTGTWTTSATTASSAPLSTAQRPRLPQLRRKSPRRNRPSARCDRRAFSLCLDDLMW
jgi:predicted ATP-dependent protease